MSKALGCSFFFFISFLLFCFSVLQGTCSFSRPWPCTSTMPFLYFSLKQGRSSQKTSPCDVLSACRRLAQGLLPDLPSATWLWRRNLVSRPALSPQQTDPKASKTNCVTFGNIYRPFTLQYFKSGYNFHVFMHFHTDREEAIFRY